MFSIFDLKFMCLLLNILFAKNYAQFLNNNYKNEQINEKQLIAHAQMAMKNDATPINSNFEQLLATNFLMKATGNSFEQHERAQDEEQQQQQQNLNYLAQFLTKQRRLNALRILKTLKPLKKSHDTNVNAFDVSKDTTDMQLHNAQIIELQQNDNQMFTTEMPLTTEKITSYPQNSNALTKLMQMHLARSYNSDAESAKFVYKTDPINAVKQEIEKENLKMRAYVLPTSLTAIVALKNNVNCSFETAHACAWRWSNDFALNTFHDNTETKFTKNNANFLSAHLTPTTKLLNFTSPILAGTLENCQLSVLVQMHNLSANNLHTRVVVVAENPAQNVRNTINDFRVVANENQTHHWHKYVYHIGDINYKFHLVYEIKPKLAFNQTAIVAFAGLHFLNCFNTTTPPNSCNSLQFKCLINGVAVCLPFTRICDITVDCDDASDEQQNCAKIPYGASCDFERDWCGWRVAGGTLLTWSRHTGALATYDTETVGDHTAGHYMHVDMNQHENGNVTEQNSLIGFGSNALMISKTFNPPPLVHGNANSTYRNTCVVRFYVYQFGKNVGSINLSVVEMKQQENITKTLWWSSKNHGNKWLRIELLLPNITHRYYFQFEARMGMRIYSNVAVDDFSLSPECFGLNIPATFLTDNSCQYNQQSKHKFLLYLEVVTWKFWQDLKTTFYKKNLHNYLVGIAIFLIAVIGAILLAIITISCKQTSEQPLELQTKKCSKTAFQMQILSTQSAMPISVSTNVTTLHSYSVVVKNDDNLCALPKVNRKNLSLTKFLGKGAFGEVFAANYQPNVNDQKNSIMTVAVKTLHEKCTKEYEQSFTMEATIMSQFEHRNIVALIGVCFEQQPRFIVQELMVGGDLKNFLLECRRRSSATATVKMLDLINCALDVAKGCSYLECKRFIHSDISARNCLLTSFGADRVVKIADFGMAHDVYRSDYYRKHGSAVLPVRWMPPEAFLNGIFTTKTDVWSFGVLMWEIFSLGLMPYMDYTNSTVIQLVTAGERLKLPTDCPQVVYELMSKCWQTAAECRPTFGEMVQQLENCKTLPELMRASIPNIFRIPKTEFKFLVDDNNKLPAPYSLEYLKQQNCNETFKQLNGCETKNSLGSNVNDEDAYDIGALFDLPEIKEKNEKLKEKPME